MRPRISIWLTRLEAAIRAGVHIDTIDAARKRGDLKSHETYGRDGRVVRVRIHRDDLDRWIRTGSSTQVAFATVVITLTMAACLGLHVEHCSLHRLFEELLASPTPV